MRKLFISLFMITTLFTYTEENITPEKTEVITNPEDLRENFLENITLEQLETLEQNINKETKKDKLQVMIPMYEEAFDRYVQKIKDDEETVFEVGDRYFKKRKYSKSAKIFASNSSTRNMFGAATAYRFLGDYKSAIMYYNTTLLIDSQIAEAYFGRGLSYRNLGDYRNAKMDIKRYMEFSPKLEGYLALGDIYLAEKNKPAAKDLLQEAIKFYPNSSELATMLKTSFIK